MEKIKIRQVVLVEGRYDKSKLESIIDGTILPVHGFSLFTDDELKKLIVKLAEERGVIVLMDSDAAGFKIRGYLRGMLPKEQVTDLYIPDVMGKEKRKKSHSKEGKIGVEGMTAPLLRELLGEVGCTKEQSPQTDPITKSDLFVYGLTGRPDSGQRRETLYKKLNFPSRMSTNAALDLINTTLSREELERLLDTDDL